MKVYVFIPLYNVKIDDNAIDKDFGGFRIITNDIFEKKYEELVHNIANDFLVDLKNDIRQRQKGELVTRELSKYILLKEADFNNFENTEREKLNSDINKLKIEIEKFILAARLLDCGRIQINNGYFFSTHYYSCFQLHSSTVLDNIKTYFYSEKICFEQLYKIDETSFTNIINTINFLEPFNDEKLLVPILYFTQYYSSDNLFDRIIKLSIILESTMLADCREELNYRLKIRTCCFLQEDYTNILSIFYEIRSNIVHNGCIEKKLYKKIKTAILNKYTNDMESLFYFVQMEVEPIVRNILYKSFTFFATSKEIKNFEQLMKKIDKNITIGVITKS